MDEVKRVYYSIREVEQETGLRISTLRFWEQQFDELNPRKDGHGNRYYTEEDMAFLKRVKYIRDEMKITRIAAIRNELKSDGKNTDVRQRSTEILLRLRQQLVELRSSL